MSQLASRAIRHLIMVLGDQLDANSTALRDIDPVRDIVLIAEVRDESTHVPSHKTRTVLFLSAMRHFRDALRSKGITVHYRALDDPDNQGSLSGELELAIRTHAPQKIVITEPGDHRVASALENSAKRLNIPYETRPDSHFICDAKAFEQHASSRKQLRLEFFYRQMRQQTGALMDDGKPTGGAWNYDAENRGSFGKHGPGLLPRPVSFKPDQTTRAVIEAIHRLLPENPGETNGFDWPVTREDALIALEDFIHNRLPDFGTYQDAMWTHEPWLYHSRLSAALNLKLLNPREVIQAAEEAYRRGHAPLAAVEGFIRQILGWREYVRAIYRHFMPAYAESNALNATLPLPAFFWTGDTRMACLQDAIGQTLRLGYAHHIQRLMVTGLYALMFGVKPQAVHEWYLAVYVDAVEWVELPNTIGMSQFADGGIMASKPYVATGKYIQRMSNYCAGCPYDPATATGPKACPFTTLYWDFLLQHRDSLRTNQRMTMQLKNLDRLSPTRQQEIQTAAAKHRAQVLEATSPWT